MEKRYLTAVVLSFLVLFGWTMLIPKQKNDNLSPLQNNTSKVDSTITSEIPAQETINQTDFQNAIPPEETVLLETDYLAVEFTNIGGNIKSILIKKYNKKFPISSVHSIETYQKEPFIVIKNESNLISFSYEDESIKILKTYKLNENGFDLNSEIIIENKSNMSKLIDTNIIGYNLETSSLDKKTDILHADESRDKAFYEYAVYTDKTTLRKNNAFKFEDKNRKKEEGLVKWIGFRDRYFCLVVSPGYETEEFYVNPLGEHELNVEMKPKKTEVGSGQNVVFSSTIYAGPEKLDLLKQYGLEFEKIKRYYRWGFLDLMGRLVYGLVHFMHNFIPSWGLCIVILSVIIYLITYPLTLRSMASMRKMQQIQPELQKIKEKYQSNPQKLQQETMAMYKKQGVNPLGGCLPALLQAPIFFGLYQALWRDVSFKDAQFLWIKDLTSPDRLIILKTKLPFMGNEINILPILMMGIMFLQQKASSKNIVVSDPVQASQQKMMGIMMPILLGVIFYKFASGLTLYFTLYYIFSTITQFKLAKSQKVA